MANDNYARTYEASPQYQWSNASTITSGSDLNVSWETQDRTSQKYLPFNFTRIVNNSGEDITFYPNQGSRGILCPAGTIQSIDARSIPALSSFRVLNSGTGTIGANEIVVTNSRTGQDIDSIIERVHKRLFGARSRMLV